MTENTSPQLAYVSVLRPPNFFADELARILKESVQGLEPDSFGEWALNVRPPGPTQAPYNGGAWVERFTTIQTEHSHKDDGLGAGERYLVILPRGADARVKILPADDSKKSEGEEYIFKQDCVSILRFWGPCPHGFATLGKTEDCEVLAFAIHKRDVATTQQALTDQTTTLNQPIPAPAPGRTYHPPEVSEITNSNDFFKGQLTHITSNMGTPGAPVWVPYAFFELAEAVDFAGKGYGAEKFKSLSSIKKWIMHHVDDETVDTFRPASAAQKSRLDMLAA